MLRSSLTKVWADYGNAAYSKISHSSVKFPFDLLWAAILDLGLGLYQLGNAFLDEFRESTPSGQIMLKSILAEREWYIDYFFIIAASVLSTFISSLTYLIITGAPPYLNPWFLFSFFIFFWLGFWISFYNKERFNIRWPGKINKFFEHAFVTVITAIVIYFSLVIACMFADTLPFWHPWIIVCIFLSAWFILAIGICFFVMDKFLEPLISRRKVS